MVRPRSFRHRLAGATGTMLLLFCATAHSQESSQTVRVTISDNDRYAASQAENVGHHARPANTTAGQAARPHEVSNMHSEAAAPEERDGRSGEIRYPGDLQYHGGPIVTFMEQHLIYVNLDHSASCSTVASCWGNPREFLRDLGRSHMIHIVDQYTGRDDNDRYTVSHRAYKADYPLSANPYTDADMLAIVHAVVMAHGLSTGYNNEYHVFLVPGQDVCFTSSFNVCYSPGNPNAFAFCAYHGRADFQDIGHVLYSVEPFQNLPGCSVQSSGPNGQLADSTNSVLSHETIETITDPDGTAWWNSLDMGLRWQEIGDECSFLLYTPNGVYFDPSHVRLNDRNYILQPEYNNARHACTTAP